MRYFYSNQLSDSMLQQLDSLELSKEYIEKYLYISTLSRILSSLEPSEQKEFIAALRNSETQAQQWLAQHTHIKEVLTEHIERVVLSLKSS